MRLVAERLLGSLSQPVGRLEVVVNRGASAAPVLAALERAGAQLQRFEFEDAEEGRRVVATARLETGVSPTRLVTGLLDVDGVRGANWTD